MEMMFIHAIRNIMPSWIKFNHFKNKETRLFHKNPVLETVKSKVIISLFETVSVSLRNLCSSLKSIK